MRWTIAVGTLTMLALVLRLASLDRRGIIGHDEAVHLLEARYLVEGGGEDRPGTAHPAHTALLAAAIRIAGWSDTRGLEVSALCGAATVPVVASIGHMLGGPWIGALGAAALAVSAFHVRYSRVGSADAAATLFLTLAVWAALRGRAASVPAGLRWRGLAVVCAAVAGLCHYRYLPAAAAVGAWSLWRLWRGVVAPRGRWRDVVAVLAGGFAPLLAVEAWYGWFRWAHGYGPDHYLRQLTWRLAEYRGGLSLESPWTQAWTFLTLDGPLVAGLVALGTVAVVRESLRGRRDGLVALIWGAGALLFWSLYSAGGIFSRCLVMALPGLALLSGYAGALVIHASGARGTVAGAALLALIIAAGLPRAWAEVEVRGGYREAALAVARDAIRRGEPARLHWYYGPVWRLYMLEAAERLGRRSEDLLEVVNTTAPPTFWNYAIVDSYVYLMDGPTRARLDRIMAASPPLGAWPNTWANDPVTLMDFQVDPALVQEGRERYDLSRLRVYRLPAGVW